MSNGEKKVLEDYLFNVIHQNKLMNEYHKYFFNQNPNITGFNFIFMIPPDLSGIKNNTNFIKNISIEDAYGITSLSMYDFANKYLTFAAVDYTFPMTQVIHGQINPRLGGVPYASDVASTENCNITYVDNKDCIIYLYHLLWTEYIRAISSGGYYDQFSNSWISLQPDIKYLTPGTPYYGTLDYACSIYVVKYVPNMNDITYIGKAIGCVPISLPSKELIGTRAVNDIAILPFDYISGAFREHISSSSINSWLFDELYFMLNNNDELILQGNYI